MTYLLWASPALAVILAIASGRSGAVGASILGLAVATAVALSAAPVSFVLGDAVISLARGAWIGWIIVPYILGGLFFWQIAMRAGRAEPALAAAMDDRARRKALFSACFLIGPFAEAATGFGVGIVGTIALVKRLGVGPVHLLAFGLLSQTMILWGGMGSGAIVAAAFARMDSTALALNSSWYMLAFNALWLPCYWRLADRAGVPASWKERFGEAAWLGVALACVILATAYLGPETAMLASYGPLIAVRYLVEMRPSQTEIVRLARGVAPFGMLIVCLVATRLIHPLKETLEGWGRLTPFEGAPSWSPFFHAGSWLIAAGVATAWFRRECRFIPRDAASAWKIGRLAVLTIIAFAMMAEVLVRSGIADGLARALYGALGIWSAGLTPFISAIFGALANSGNAANGLFMASQLSLASEAGLSITALASLQQAAALSLNIVSPVRMSIVCGLAGLPGHERDAYRIMLPFAACVLVVLMIGAALVVTRVL